MHNTQLPGISYKINSLYKKCTGVKHPVAGNKLKNKFSIQEVYGCDTPSCREYEVKYVAGERVNMGISILAFCLQRILNISENVNSTNGPWNMLSVAEAALVRVKYIAVNDFWVHQLSTLSDGL